MRTTIAVPDMFCAQCERRIEAALRAVQGVAAAKASLGAEAVTVDFAAPCDEERVCAAIRQTGYSVASVHRNDGESDTDARGGAESPVQAAHARAGGNSLANGISILVIVFSLWYIVNAFGLTAVFQRFPTAKSGMSYAMLFVIGVLTSFHCVAMCGGLHLAALEASDSIVSPFSNPWMRPDEINMYYAMGASLMNCFPFLKKLRLPLPRGTGGVRGARFGAFAVGLLNGFVPCGALQTMQLLAMSSGSAVKGALSLFFFGAGTAPLVILFSFAAGSLKARAKNAMALAGGTLIVVFALAMLQNNSALLGIQLAHPASAPQMLMEAAVFESADGTPVQTITTEVQSGAYPSFTARAGVPLVWNLHAADGVLNGCNNEIVIPDYNISLALHAGDNIVTLTPKKAGRINYSCWMGMIQAYILVTE